MFYTNCIEIVVRNKANKCIYIYVNLLHYKQPSIIATRGGRNM